MIQKTKYHVHIYNVIQKNSEETRINLEKIILKDCLRNERSMEGRNYTLWKVGKL